MQTYVKAFISFATLFLVIAVVFLFGASMIYQVATQHDMIAARDFRLNRLNADYDALLVEYNETREALMVSYYNQCLDNIGDDCSTRSVQKFARFQDGLTGRF